MEIEPQAYAQNNQVPQRDAKDIIQEILDDGIENQVKLIVDVGCGNGDVTRMLAKALPSAKILGFDILPPMISYSKAELTAEEASRIDYVVQDFCADFKEWNEKLRNLEGKVDLIWSLYALHYAPLEKRKEIMKALVRLLKPGGRLYVDMMVARDFLPSLPSGLFEKNRGLVTIPPLKRQRETWLEYFQPEEIDCSLSSVKVDVVEKEWRGSKDDKYFTHYRSRTFVNFFRPFIHPELSEKEKDGVLESCMEYVFSPSIVDTLEGERMYCYDCAQIRCIK